jgi:hypothetical protein
MTDTSAHAAVRSLKQPMSGRGIQVTIWRRIPPRPGLGQHTSDMNLRWLLGIAVLALIAAAVVTWRAWPRDPGPVAPPVTARELRQFDHFQVGSVTLVGGGSKSQAHRLWVYYSHRRTYQGIKPRLLGISRVRLSGTSEYDGVYWLVYSDHVYTPNLGAEGGGGYGREAVLVPDDSDSTNGNTLMF